MKDYGVFDILGPIFGGLQFPYSWSCSNWKDWEGNCR